MADGDASGEKKRKGHHNFGNRIKIKNASNNVVGTSINEHNGPLLHTDTPPAAPPAPCALLVLIAKDLELEAFREALASKKILVAKDDERLVGVYSFALGPRQCKIVCMKDQGPVDAAAYATAYVYEFSPAYIFTVGICGGRKDAVMDGEVLLANKLWLYDKGKVSEKGEFKPEAQVKVTEEYGLRAFASAHGNASPKISASVSLLCTNAVRNDPIFAQADALKYAPEATGVDMESYGIATAVAVLSRANSKHIVKLLPVCKAVSDIPGQEGNEEKRMAARLAAAKNAAKIGVEYLCQFFDVPKTTVGKE